MGLSMVAGSPLTTFENAASQHVAVIDTTTATALGVSPARLASHPAVFVDGVAYTVVGIYSSAQRVVTNSSAMLIPENTAIADFGNPQPGIGNQDEAQMVVATGIGAAQAVARQIAAAERPTDPSRLVVTSPPNPKNLQSEVSGDLAGLFLILALISLLIGAIGIANTTLVAVLERTEEIGLRRAVGARPRHIAAQFLAESTALGTLGGLIGTCIGVWGTWGYLGAGAAEQYGFRFPPGSALSALGIDRTPSTTDPASLPQAEQAAIGRCATIVQDFTNTAQDGALAGIGALSNDVADDVLTDAAVKSATQAWSACMAKNGYSFHQPQDVFRQEIQDMYGGGHSISATATVSAAANQAQIAAAVTDADCTQSADLAGIYFAVQASYEQQLVNANAQALTAAVQRYRAAYAKELSKLPALLKTATASPFPSASPARAGSSPTG